MYTAPSVIKPNPVKKWIRTNFLERTLQRLPKSNMILDLCTGYGFYFSINPKAKGVDGDPNCVMHLKNRGFDVIHHDVLKRLPFHDNEFEYVIAHDVLEHFTYDELKHIFHEVNRILKPGGCFLIIVPNKKGYDYGLRVNAGHKLFVTSTEIESLSQKKFEIKRNYPEPLPRYIGKFFTHNKEVFELIKH